jgi:hypothetical protein
MTRPPLRSPSTTPSAPNSTASTSGVSDTQTTTTSAARAASAAVDATAPPSPARSSDRPADRFQPVTSNPARRRFAAMAAPIVPSPMNAIRSTRVKPPCRTLSVPATGAAYHRPVEWLGIDRRRLGTAMVVFGLVGLVIAGVVAAALIGGAFAARNLDDRLEADQARIAATLQRVSGSMTSLASTTDHAADTLATTSATLTDAGAVLDSASEASRELSSNLNISILGSQPFEGASRRLATLADTIDTFKGRADELAQNVDLNASDTAAMSEAIASLQGDLDDLAARVAEFDRIGAIVDLVLGGILLAALLTAWVAVLAAFVAWAGWKLRRVVAVVIEPG